MFFLFIGQQILHNQQQKLEKNCNSHVGTTQPTLPDHISGSTSISKYLQIKHSRTIIGRRKLSWCNKDVDRKSETLRPFNVFILIRSSSVRTKNQPTFTNLYFQFLIWNSSELFIGSIIFSTSNAFIRIRAKNIYVIISKK